MQFKSWRGNGVRSEQDSDLGLAHEKEGQIVLAIKIKILFSITTLIF